MNYTKKSFSVLAPSGSTYADNWERTFRKPKVPGCNILTEYWNGDGLPPECGKPVVTDNRCKDHQLKAFRGRCPFTTGEPKMRCEKPKGHIGFHRWQ